MTESEFTSRYNHTVEIPVAWGEMDAFAHVNNIVYFRYLETARIAYFTDNNLVTADLKAPFGPVLAHIQCQFKRPVLFPDTIIVGSRLHHLGTTSFKISHEIFSRAQGEVVLDSDSVIVWIEYSSGAKTPLPEALRSFGEGEISTAAGS